MSSTTSNIRLVCFVRGKTKKDIFPVVIDNDSTVENLGVEIRMARQDLSQKNFDLYVRKFKQANYALVNTVNTTEKGGSLKWGRIDFKSPEYLVKNGGCDTA